MMREPEKSPYFIDLNKSPCFKQSGGLETRVLTGLHGERTMMVLNTTLPRHSMPTHSHPHKQVGMVYSGEAMLRIGKEERHVKKGDFYCIPANIPHSDIAIGDEPFVILDIFYTVREDFIEKYKKTLT